MSEFREIKIRDVQRNGDLVLSSDKLPANKKDTVIWTIKKGVSVESIVAIVPKDPRVQTIFDCIECDGATWQGTIREGAAEGDFEYNIVWRDFAGDPHTYDPIISVRPTGAGLPIPKILLGFALGVAAFFTFKQLRSHKKHSNTTKE